MAATMASPADGQQGRDGDGIGPAVAQQAKTGPRRGPGVDGIVGDRVDAAYRDKYRRYSGTYVDPMVAPQPRATTLKLVPR